MMSGKELLILRTQVLNLSSREFGRKIGMSYTSVTKRETGVIPVDPRFINRVFRVFGVTDETVATVREICNLIEDAKETFGA